MSVQTRRYMKASCKESYQRSKQSAAPHASLTRPSANTIQTLKCANTAASQLWLCCAVLCCT